MKSYLILLPIFLLALLQGTILPLNLVLLTVLIWAVIRPTGEGLMVAFFAGLFLDLAQGTILGLSSVLFLLVCFAASLYSRRFDSSHPVFLAGLAFLATILYNLIFQKFWFIEGLLLAILAFFLRPVVKLYRQETSGRELKLKL